MKKTRGGAAGGCGSGRKQSGRVGSCGPEGNRGRNRSGKNVRWTEEVMAQAVDAV